MCCFQRYFIHIFPQHACIDVEKGTLGLMGCALLYVPGCVCMCARVRVRVRIRLCDMKAD